MRLEKTLPVKFDLPEISTETRPFEALSRNIGEGGVFIETDMVQDESFALGKEVKLNLEIELLGQAQRIKAQGKIVWMSKKSRIPYKRKNGFGVRFIQIASEEKKAILVYISKETLAQNELAEKEIPSIAREQKLTDRQRRNLQILDTIRKNRLISRAEISKDTDINIVTVSNYIDLYIKKSLVFERGLDISTGGRRPELVEINPHYGYVIGVDLGPLNRQSPKMQVVATDFTTHLLTRAEDERVDDSIENSLDILTNLLAQVLASKQLERRRIRGIGIGISGVMDKFAGTVRNPITGDTFANYVTIKKELEDKFSLPVFIENSACCALFAEKWSGINLDVKTADNIIYVYSQHQCAVMLNGELYTGTGKSAGQLHLAFPRSNFSNSEYCWMDSSCDCILRMRHQDLDKCIDSKEKLLSGGTKLGAKIAFLVNIFNPQIVIIGRNFSHLGDTFLDTIRRTVNRWAFRESANLVRIIPTTLGEESVALGAASLVIETAFVNI
jgi:predicted NBD/HSP70 family sugar kinase/Tfp pilus assembly protein PilZ